MRFDSFAEGAPWGAGGVTVAPALRTGLISAATTSPSRGVGRGVARGLAPGGEYLLRHQRDDGSFGYSYLAKRDKYDPHYDLLRHAGTCYALGELFQATGDRAYLEAARRSRSSARQTKEQCRSGLRGHRLAGQGGEAGRGGAGDQALLRYQEAAGDDAWADRLSPLARFLVFQQEADGRFESKYFYGPPDPEPFESIYYPGEAILRPGALSAR